MVKFLPIHVSCLLLTLAWPAWGQSEKQPEWSAEEKELAGKAAKLHTEGKELFGLGKSREAAEKFAQALAMRERLYPEARFKDGHPDLADSLNGMGVVLWTLGESAKALSYTERALAMRERLYPEARFKDGHPDLANSLNNMGVVLESLGEPAKALSYYERALAMYERLYPPARFQDGHPRLAASLNNMGAVLKSLGKPAKALSYYERALAMYLQLYPPARFKDGHPRLATSLNGMGGVLWTLGEPAKALSYYERTLAMRERLYPPARFKDGHPDLAHSLNNMGLVLESLGEPAKALSYYERALAMRERLYPPARFQDGHPDLAGSLYNMGVVLRSLGEPAKALSYYERALAMRERLYPPARFKNGHPDLVANLHNMGLVLWSLGEPAKALTCFEQAFAMDRQIARRETRQMSEAAALAYRLAQPRARDAHLSLAVSSATSSAVYMVVWQTRGGALPLLQARHRGVVALTLTADQVRQDYAQLVAVRQQLSRLQRVFPRDETALRDRDKQFVGLNDEQDRLERRLAAALPAFQQLQELAAKGPADLARLLPQNTAFVDFVRYRHRDKGQVVGPRYVAFVLLPGKEARLVPLGDAQPIDAAVAAWRRHIVGGETSLAPAKLRELIWDRIAKELPAQTKRVYLCPDGDLARLPFAALPGARPGTVLLEDYRLAVVPSGLWLLEQLLFPPKPSTAPDRVLAVGAVAYGRGGDSTATAYPALTGTGREMKRVLEAFGQQARDGLAGNAATTTAVREHLRQVRYAHFATHGYFDAKGLGADRKRLKDYLEKWSFSADDGTRAEPAGLGLRNPAGYVGLVLAGANEPAKAGPDGGILTGLSVVDLPLEQLRLCVLSACETGLGELTEAEGVLGLQRSFHAAGCPNVVGSLWQVDDEATAALMAQFYHELRGNGRPPLEALAEAQLTLYRHPERIPALAGSRGAINQADTVKLGSKAPEAKPGAGRKTTPVKLWAAFVLSGLGE